MSSQKSVLNQDKVSTQVAQAYNELGRKYHEMRKGSGLFYNEFLEVPATLSVLPKTLTGKTVYDAGCGSGLYSIRLARLGAKVFGMDLSDSMIQIAQEEKPSDLDISYQVGDICKTPFESGTFDLAISNYVLENIQDLSRPMGEFFRLLKPSGTLLFSVSHPIRAMANRVKSEASEDWILENYFSGGTRESDLGNGLKVIKFKHTLSDYINACTQAGFQIRNITEPQPIAEGKEKDPHLYELGMRLPQLMLIQATR
jgi:2-polyprenyl-3-methyl-5-hydroxy-6-metoxy-1,4-benzoquinol methylase